MFNKRNKRRLASIEYDIENIREMLDKIVPHVEELDFTEVKVEWVDKKKRLIVCNRCGGTGKEDDRYSGKTKCRFCDDKKVVQLSK